MPPADFSEDVSTFNGAHYVERGSPFEGKDGSSHRCSEQREQVLDPAEIARGVTSLRAQQ
ncbi:hypothetical protein [Streptomyces sp. NPDC053367]|uniref:hypothetical protein n=1 Tax=Streptomyces sp. NPDC053367 TaxID=3365700 RepID=UPI0037CE2356